MVYLTSPSWITFDVVEFVHVTLPVWLHRSVALQPSCVWNVTKEPKTKQIHSQFLLKDSSTSCNKTKLHYYQNQTMNVGNQKCFFTMDIAAHTHIYIYNITSLTIYAKWITYVISVLHNLTDAHWWRSEAVEMHVCKLSIRKWNLLKYCLCYKTIGSRLACVRRVMDALGKLLGTGKARVALTLTLPSRLASRLPCASLTRRTHANSLLIYVYIVYSFSETMLKTISRDTDNNAAMYNCWWTNENLLFSSTNMAAMTKRENHLYIYICVFLK